MTRVLRSCSLRVYRWGVRETSRCERQAARSGPRVTCRSRIEANPCLDVERIAVKASDDFNILSPMEFEAVVRECGGPREVAVLSVAFYAGLRLGELRELRWRDVDWARRMLYAALAPAGLSQRRADVDKHGDPQKPIVFHDLRHSYCSWAVDVWPIPDVQVFAGHRDISATMKYVHRTAKAAHAAVADEALRKMLVPIAADADIRQRTAASR
jgi:integrase